VGERKQARCHRAPRLGKPLECMIRWCD